MTNICYTLNQVNLKFSHVIYLFFLSLSTSINNCFFVFRASYIQPVNFSREIDGQAIFVLSRENRYNGVAMFPYLPTVQPGSKGKIWNGVTICQCLPSVQYVLQRE